MVRACQIMILVFFVLAVVIIFTGSGHCSSKKVPVRIMPLKDEAGHTYVLLRPVLAPDLGAWSDGPLLKGQTGTGIQLCEQEEHVIAIAKDAAGIERPVSAMYLHCPDGHRYRIVDIWFTPPEIHVGEPK